MNEREEQFLEEEETVVVTEQGMFGDLNVDFEIIDPTVTPIKK